MKKIFAVLLACLTVLIFVPSTARALDDTENTHLFGPTAVCATDDRVFVADNNNGNNLLYVFDSNGYVTKNLASVATKLDFSNEKVFALLQDKIVIFDLQNNTTKTITATGAKDFDVFDNNLFVVFDCGIGLFYVDNIKENSDLANQNLIATGTSISGVAFDGTNLYFADGNVLFKKSDKFEKVGNVNIGDRLVFADDTLFSFNNKQINGVDVGFEIADVYAVNKNKIYAISTNDFSVKSLKQTQDGFALNTFVLGTNHKNFDTTFGRIDSFEKLSVCKTNKRAFVFGVENGDETNNRFGYIPQDTTLLKLKETNGFAYVLYTFEKKHYFGFISSNDVVNVPVTQLDNKKVTITSNQRMYTIPVLDDQNVVKDNQNNQLSIENTQEITVFAELTDFDNGKWVFVKTQNVFGFMLKAKLKNPPSTYPVYQFAKANPPIGKNLFIYETASENSTVLAKIASGKEIKVFETAGEYTKVSVNIDGERIEGWAKSNHIIADDKLTNTTSLGLVIAICLVLVVGFVLTWKMFHKKKVFDEE